MAIIVDGKKIASTILNDLKTRVDAIKSKGGNASLAVVLVGDDKPSQTYVRKKEEAAKAIGVQFFKLKLSGSISKDELISEIKKIQSKEDLTGLIVQLPLPKHLRDDTREIVNHIESNIDVDCLNYLSLGKVLMGTNLLLPPTPSAIMEILKYHDVDLVGKNVVLIGRGNLIGKPLSAMLMHYPVTVTVCGSECHDLNYFTTKADIIVTGVGKYNILSGDMVKDGVAV
ncbi:bifunctional 5,10-methylenetetrahydrofolate dehydrogenase/5,10-methenyltetrahydrofolate cyclohydrolase, partial [bacterium]|nr:bifunctional 5,10-methylenetetrahydrofolate dehydrogenase/5,10-methenyltetrahydrofolate cyclohydrolase [bacterium]